MMNNDKNKHTGQECAENNPYLIRARKGGINQGLGHQ